MAPAHQECFRKFINEIILDKADESDIVVDNTNLHASEISPYYLAAESFGYEVQILRIHYDPNVAFERQQHRVPRAIHNRMVHDFNRCDVLPWWNVEDVEG